MPPSPARRALSLGAALFALLAVVGLAARGHLAGAGGGPTRHVSTDIVLEYVLLLMGVGVLIAFPVLAFGLQQVRKDPDLLPKRRNWMLRAFGTMTGLALAAVGWLAYRWIHGHHVNGVTLRPQPLHPGVPHPRTVQPRSVRFDLAPAIVVLSVAAFAAAVGAFFYLRARRGRGPDRARAAIALSEALDESLDDLRRESDARRAVIAAYARMERALSASGLPRHQAEAPLEYLARVLRDLLRASAASVTRLTDLFERAKFSQHAVGPDMKDEAIAALVAVRDELKAYS
jgi:hypothetical protein